MKRLLFILLLLLPSLSHAREGVDAKALVMEHLADGYSWHITAIGNHHLSIPLPVILRGSDGRWHAFSSSHLGHGAVYRGFQIGSQGKIIEVATGKRPLDLSITKNALAIMINSLIVVWLILSLAGWYRKGEKNGLTGRQGAPKGIRGCVEMVIEYVHDEVIVPCVGEEYRRYAPWLLTLFFFILVSNLMGLIPIFPAGANVTGNIAITFTLAVCTFVVVNVSGSREYWREILWPEVPTWLKAPIPLMPLIELIGIFTKPFALMIRLFANIFAGHAVILALVGVIFVTVSMGPTINTGMSVLAVVFGIFMLFLELLVAFIQAYVFTLLSAVFVGMARIKHVKH